MANALMLERILGTGQFKSPAALAAKLGISRSVVSELLGMLNLPPAEIERILFETRAREAKELWHNLRGRVGKNVGSLSLSENLMEEVGDT